jgi:uncharacterized protein (DUF2336 family)
MNQFADCEHALGGRFDDIYLAISALVEHQKSAFTQHERDQATDILKRISKNVEMSIRIRLAEQLAEDPSAPHELILLLADDRIEVARLVLARSPVLCDADLIHVIQHGTSDHQIAVAARPAIGETVSAALARSACEAALIALLRNSSAKLTRQTFEDLGERARRFSSLQEPLVLRRDLPPELASHLYIWVSGALKTALSSRYPDIAQSLMNAIDQSSLTAQSGEPQVAEANAKKLVQKLHASGQLRASFLIRVLNQGQMELFEHAFAALLSMEVDIMRRALYGENPMTVALACRAAGIDRAVFLTVFNLSRHHRRVTAQLSDSDRQQIGDVFSHIRKTEALDRLKTQAA